LTPGREIITFLRALPVERRSIRDLVPALSLKAEQSDVFGGLVEKSKKRVIVSHWRGAATGARARCEKPEAG
jgi:hypothetical protein